MSAILKPFERVWFYSQVPCIPTIVSESLNECLFSYDSSSLGYKPWTFSPMTLWRENTQFLYEWKYTLCMHLFWDRVSFWRAMFVYLLTCVHGCRCLWRLERGIGSLSARFPSGCEPPLWVLGIELESFAKVGYSTLQPWNGVTCSPGKSLTGCELRRTLNFWFSYFPTAGISGTNQCTWFI